MSKVIDATKEDVRGILPPERTRTWNPVSHGAVVDSIDRALSSMGLGVMNSRFELSKNGDNLFGTYRLDHDLGGRNLEIGFRNSTSKKFAVGITAGTFTIVCSNLVFTGEYVEFRKHTAGLTLDEMQIIANRAINNNIKSAEHFAKWQDGLIEIELGGGLTLDPSKGFRSDFENLVFAAMATGAIPPSKFGQLLDSYHEERDRGGDTLYTFYQTLTNTLNTTSRQNIAERSRKINNLTEFYERHGIAPAASFYEQLEAAEADDSTTLPAVIEPGHVPEVPAIIDL